MFTAGALLFRRRAPFVVPLAVASGAVAFTLLDATAAYETDTMFLVLILAAWAAGSLLDARQALIALGALAALGFGAAALVGIRGAKSQAKVSMRAPLARVEVTGPPALVEAASAAAADLRRAGHVQGDLVFTPATDATEISVAAELAEVPED